MKIHKCAKKPFCRDLSYTNGANILMSANICDFFMILDPIQDTQACIRTDEQLLSFYHIQIGEELASDMSQAGDHLKFLHGQQCPGSQSIFPHSIHTMLLCYFALPLHQILDQLLDFN